MLGRNNVRGLLARTAASRGRLAELLRPSTLAVLLVVFSGTGAPAADDPDISLSHSDLELGVVPPGASSTTSLTVSNEGIGPLVVTSITSNDAHFTVNPQALAVTAGGTAEVAVTYSPISEGYHNGTLTLTSNDPDQPNATAEVAGICTLPVDLTIYGGEAERSLTSSVAAGDVNGDGMDDILVQGGYQGQIEAPDGHMYVVYGSRNRASPSELDLATDRPDVLAIRVPAQLSPYVLSVNLNRDGFDEIITASNQRTYVISGSASPSSPLDLSTPTVPVVTVDAGFILASGDVDGDGVPDLVGGQEGGVNVLFGRDDLFTSPPSGPDVVISNIPGIGGSAPTGRPVAAGDINGDGRADVIVGTGSAMSVPTIIDRVFVILGGPGLESHAFDPAAAALTLHHGFVPVMGLGHGVASGDVNGDGFDDIVAGSADRVDIVYGHEWTGSAAIDLAAGEGDLVIVGMQARVIGCAFVNDDEYADILLGLSDRPVRRHYEVAVVYGGPDLQGPINLNDELPDVAVYPSQGHACVGDMDGSERADLIVGDGGFGRAGTMGVGMVRVVYDVAGPADDGPRISLSAAELELGRVVVGESSTLTVTVSNTGNASLVVTGITVTGTDSGEFSASPTSFAVAVDGSQAVTVRFSPASVGTKHSALAISSNDSDAGVANLVVSGIGLEPSVPPSCGVTFDLPERWSMISLPCEVEDPSLEALFPGATSLFEFAASYQMVTQKCFAVEVTGSICRHHL